MKYFFAFAALVAVALADPKIYFQEDFLAERGKWEDRWVQSTFKGDQQGKFVLSAGKWYGDAEKDQGLQTSEDARFYGASAKFTPFSNLDKDLVIQFTVKHEQNIDCGGGYVKLFDCSLDQTQMHGDSPYSIMFGPDICGPGTKKVHVIFNYKGKNHLINKDIRCKDDVFTHLYTLIVRAKDQTYEVRIDNEKVEEGELEKDWDFLPPKMVKDPEAEKPKDWDEREKIDDPEDTKPEDWDQPEYIADPDAKTPEDWDDEMDGEWEAPQINNPEFKGEWSPKKIDNPNYQGVWVHPEITNPEYVPDDELYLQKEICHVGFDLWQVKSGSIFDNILITDDADFAREVGDETWGKTKDAEKLAKDAFDAAEKAKEEEATKKEKEETEKDNQDVEDDGEDDKEEHDEL